MKPGEASQCFWKFRTSRETRHAIICASSKHSKILRLTFLSKEKKRKVNLAQKSHETGIFICFLLSGLWVRARQKTSSESKILVKKTVSLKKKKTKHRNHVGKDFKADGILWLFLNNSGFRSVK